MCWQRAACSQISVQFELYFWPLHTFKSSIYSTVIFVQVFTSSERFRVENLSTFHIVALFIFPDSHRIFVKDHIILPMSNKKTNG